MLSAVSAAKEFVCDSYSTTLEDLVSYSKGE